MPWNNATQIVVGANGQISVGPTTATAPSEISSALTGFSQLGFVSDAGANVSESKEITDVEVWQAFYPARKMITARQFEISFTMRQWNGFNIKFAFGGGTITSQGGGKWSFTPPSASVIDERSMVLDWQDGTKNYRIYVPRGLAIATVESTMVRTAASDLAITFAALSDGVTDPYKLYTDDAAFNQSS
jgi:hypothetical protein